MSNPTRLLPLAIAAVFALNLHAAGTTDTPSDKSDAKPEARTTAKPETGALKPFAEVIRGARQKAGLFAVWEKDDKVWLEIPEKGFDQPFFFSIGQTHGIGERGIYGGQMGPAYMASFRRIGDRVQLIAHNAGFTAKDGTPQAIAVREGFSDSLLSATTVVSQPHPERKSVLIDANALLLADIPMGAYTLERAFRLPYTFDAKQSAITRSRADADVTALQVSAHYALSRIPVPNPLPPNAPPTPQPTLPSVLEDPRSLFLGYHYSFTRLPEPMRPRLADGRIGHFVTTRWDFGSDHMATPRQHFVNRWRIEKKDPEAAVSDAKAPIVYWLDKNIPEQYRKAITEGVLAWNKAFEQIGIRNALVVKQQDKDADFDTAEGRRASIRWFVGADVGFAIGPSRTDPRTGEILDADIGLSDVFARGARQRYREEIPRQSAIRFDDGCNYAEAAAEQMHFALDVLEARGDIEPDSPEEERFVQDVLRDVTMHEVGHTLGLRHNFRASTVYTPAQLADKSFTEKNGIAGSVMDYTPPNLALKGEKQGAYNMLVLGPYDYWAIEYAYKPIAAEDEKTELARIAARSTEPLLAFATDEDANGRDGIDPAVNLFDLGSDPLGYYEKRVKLSRELFDRLATRPMTAGESYAVLRRNVERGLEQIRRVAELATKYVGGMTQLRDHAGSGRAPLTPVPASEQRRALKLIAGQMLSVDSFRLPPDFLRKLVPDPLERRESGQPFNLSLSQRVLSIQRDVLERLYQDQTAARMLDYGSKAGSERPLGLAELYDTLQAAIWEEAREGREADPWRRSLQREHLRVLVKSITQPGNTLPADARALQRENARALSVWLSRAALRAGLSKETRAHYADAQNTLAEALRASYTRTGA
jgi:hypothetical protein